jgi:hypothetical protein
VHGVFLRTRLLVTFRLWPDDAGEWFADIVAFTPIPDQFEDPWRLE